MVSESGLATNQKVRHLSRFARLSHPKMHSRLCAKSPFAVL
jgi:hypothetical protein